jgi:hypothetical protein
MRKLALNESITLADRAHAVQQERMISILATTEFMAA